MRTRRHPNLLRLAVFSVDKRTINHLNRWPITNNGEGQTDGDNTSKDFIEVDGEVLELLPAASFKIRLENGLEILGHLSGKMRMNRIRLLPGDKVKIQMTPYDLTKGRVTYRY